MGVRGNREAGKRLGYLTCTEREKILSGWLKQYTTYCVPHVKLIINTQNSTFLSVQGENKKQVTILASPLVSVTA